MLDRCDLLAFGIGSPLMALWLLAAGVPVLIHLLSRRRYREMTWAAMEFLLAAMRKQARRMWWEQWLLLVVRTSIVLALAAAWMDLYLDDVDMVPATEHRVHRLFVLDGSYSMAAPLGDGTRFQRAKELIVAAVEKQSRTGDAFSLVLLGAPPRAVVRTATTDRDYFAAEVQQITVSHGTAELAPTLTVIREVLERAQSDLPPPVRHEVIVLTDLQRNTWQTRGDDKVERGRPQVSWESLASAARLAVIDLGRGDEANVAVTHMALSEPFALAGRESTVLAQVQSFADQPLGNIGVELLVDGRRVEARTVILDKPRGRAAVAFHYRWPAAGDHALEVRLFGVAGDLELDNHRYLALTARERLHVLCVGGKPKACDFLPFALAPEGQGKALVDPEIASPAALRGPTDLAQYDAIVLVNVGQWSPTEARRLAAYLDQGGGLIFFLGDQTAVESYNRELGMASSGNELGLLPVQLVELAPPGNYHVDPLDYRHPIAAPFAGQSQAGLATTPLHRYVRLRTLDRAARVALAVKPSGDPLLVEGPTRRGHVVVVATDASTASVDASTRQPWTYWPLWPSFLPVVQESLRVALAGRVGQRSVLVGESLNGSVTGVLTQATVTITTPTNRTESVRPTHDGERTQWSFAETIASGIYRAAWNTPGTAPQSYAVNVDSVESDLARVDPAELPRVIQVVANELPDTERTSSQVERHRGLHEPLLYATLALLLGETLLAWWFGRRAA